MTTTNSLHPMQSTLAATAVKSPSSEEIIRKLDLPYESRCRTRERDVADRPDGEREDPHPTTRYAPWSRCECTHLTSHHRDDTSCLWPGCHAARAAWQSTIAGKRSTPAEAEARGTEAAWWLVRESGCRR